LPTPDICFFRGSSLQALNRLNDALVWYSKGYTISDKYIDNLIATLDLYIELNKPFDALTIINNYLIKYPAMTEYLNRYKLKFTEMAINDKSHITSFEVSEVSMHYFVPIKFLLGKQFENYMVDTGATFITIPSSIEDQLGVLRSYWSQG
jgi:hypothetical protein